MYIHIYIMFLHDTPSTHSAEIRQCRIYARDETVNLNQNLLQLIDLGIETATNLCIVQMPDITICDRILPVEIIETFNTEILMASQPDRTFHILNSES
jgi:hypothetical protein